MISLNMKSQYAILAVILLLSLFLRCFEVFNPQFIWGDERYQVNTGYELSKNLPPSERGEFSPVFQLLLAASFKLFGFSLFTARFVTALLSTLTVLYVYLLGKSLGGSKVGVLASLLLALEPRHVIWSRMAVAYAPMLFFATAGFYHAHKAIELSSRRQSLLAGILFSLSILTKTFGIIFIVILIVWVIWNFRGQLKITNWSLLSLIHKHLDILIMVLLPAFTFFSWYTWASYFKLIPYFVVAATPEEYGYTGGDPFIWYLWGGGRGFSLLYFVTFNEEYLGIFLSLLFAIALTSSLLKDYRKVLKDPRMQNYRNIRNNTLLIVSIAIICLITSVYLQYAQIFLHSQFYLFKLSFWIGVFITLGLFLTLWFFNGKRGLPFIWVLVTLVLYSFEQVKYRRHLFPILSGLILSCSLMFTPLLESQNRIEKTVALILLFLTIAQYLYLDITVSARDALVSIHGLWPLSI